jgi:protein-disulfide isomerase
MIATLLSTSAFSSTDLEKKVTAFEKQRVSKSLQRMGGELKNVELVLKKDLKQNGWVGYTFNLEFQVKGKEVSQKDTLFSDGKNISMDLINLENKRSFKTMMYPTLTKEFFKKSHLIEGNPDAKHSLVIFSDPLCPICIDEIPFVLKQIIKNPKNIAVYYYHLPLDMHPTAPVLSKASILATEQGIKNVDYRIYQVNFPEKYNFDAYAERNEKKVLEFFNKEFGTNITMKQINDPRLDKMIEDDIKMSEKAFVGGTPTLFFDGEYDYTRTKFEKYLK